ncbi:MAG: oligosaccharide flippase family protein [Bacteroidia bacterium]|nr:oligosaccharide flippase family protein [Bacteroidia bacterium]
MSVIRRLASQTLIFGLGHILAKVLNLFLTPWITGVEHISKADFGVFSKFYAYVSFINIIITFGMETTFFRFIQDEDDPKKIYSQAFIWVSIMASLFLAIILGFHDDIASLMGYPGQGLWVLLLGSVIFLDGIAALPMAKLRQEEKAGRFSGILLANVIVNLVLNYVLIVILKKDLTYIFIANLAASAVKLALALIGNLPHTIRPEMSSLRPMLGYAFFIMIAGFAGIMNETFDRATIPDLWPDGKLFAGEPRTGEEMNGIYGAVYKVAMLINLAIQAFRYAAEPFFFNRAKEKDSPQTFAKVFHYFIISALIGFLFIGSFSQEIVSFNFWGLTKFSFIGKSYWIGLPVVPILLMAYVFSGAYLNMSIWFKITKQVRFALLFTGTGALITILGNYLFVPTYGYFASAWATLVCYVVMTILVYFVGQRYYPIPYKLGRISIYGLVFVAAFFLNRSIGPTDGFILAFIAKLAVCLICTGALFVLEKWKSPFETESKA